MMANDPGAGSPGMPRRSFSPGTTNASSLLGPGDSDMAFLGAKDRVIGELTSRMRRPLNASASAGFDKNKRDGGGHHDGDFQTRPRSNSGKGKAQIQVYEISRPNKPTSRGARAQSVNESYSDEEESQPGPRNYSSEVKNLAHFPVAINPKTTEKLLSPQSASAPNSPRLPKRNPLAITVTSSATVNVSKKDNDGRTASRSVSRPREPVARCRSKSPNPRSGSSLAVPSGSHVSRASPASSSSASRATSRSPARRSARASPSPSGRDTSPNNMATARRYPNSSARTNGSGPSLNRSISADPNLNDPAIRAKIGNRMTKVVNKTIGPCGVCGKAVADEGCTAFGKVYHKDCFKCTVCRRKIDGRFFEKDGKPYCPKDYAKLQDKCSVCSQPIKGDCIELAKKTYHPACCKCQICGETVRGKYFTHKGLPICEQDYKSRAEKCTVCGTVITGTYYNLGEEILCEADYKARCDTCPRCGDEVSGCEIVRITGASFHPKCFTCVECGKKLAHEPFISDDKQNIYCEEDYNLKKAIRCTYCKKPIAAKKGEKTVPRLRALGKDFHPDCFRCEDCGTLLDSRVKGKECYPWRNHILCLKCNRKKFSSDEESSGDD